MVTLTNCFFRRNSIEGSGGGAIDAASVTADHSVFENNHAGTGGLGGAIAAGKLSVDSASFIDNGRYGSGEGGAIFVAGLSGADTVTDSSFVGNKAQTGGAIGASVPSLTLTNTDFASNEASQGGGGIRVGSGATATLTDTTLFVNRSFQIDGVSPYPVPGGGLLNLGTATIVGGLLIGNDPDDCAGSGTTTGC